MNTRLPSIGLELVITRMFAAPREVLWEAWTDLHRARQWWGPMGFTIPELGLAMRPGGVWRAVMHSPDETQYPEHGLLRDVEPLDRLAFSLFWGDDEPVTEMAATVSFVERGPTTLVTFRKGPFPSAEWHRVEEAGWHEAFDRLQTLVEGQN